MTDPTQAFLPISPLPLRLTSPTPLHPPRNLPTRPHSRHQISATATQRPSTPSAPSTPLRPSKSQRRKDAAPLPPGLHKAIPYFAYFSNMNPNIMGPTSKHPSRRVPLLHTAVAILKDHTLVFDVPGLPPEPAFANLRRKAGSEVHGVVHWLSPSHFDQVARSEGVLPPGPAQLLPPFLRLAEVREVTVNVASAQGDSVVLAKTFVFASSRVPWPVRTVLRPSRRYLRAGIDGAEYRGVGREYVRGVLGKIEGANWLLGGFGGDSRPHLLDRPNPEEVFGKGSSELYSPFKSIRARKAVEVFERAEGGERGSELGLLHLSDVDGGRRGGLRRMYYLPGIDGGGKSILSQMDGLDRDGEYLVACVTYPAENRQSLEEMACAVIELVLDDCDGGAVSFLGESMGGALGILVARENMRRKGRGEDALEIDLLMMINPATCYHRSTPRVLWDTLLRVGFTEGQYNALLPPVLLPFVVDMNSATQDLSPSTLTRLRKMLGMLSGLSDALPQDAMTHRLKLLSGLSLSREELARLGDEFGPRQIAVICSTNDALLPSLSEGKRLQRYIPGLYLMVLPFGGHCAMFDKRFSLANFLRPFKAANIRPKPTRAEPANPKLEARRRALRKRLFKGNGSVSVDGVESKSRSDVRRLRDWLSVWTKRCSPVFIGEENIPPELNGKPVLFVCNHTLLGWLDGMYPSLRLMSTRDMVLRPLAHPILFKRGSIVFANTPTVSVEEMREFGMVQVSPTALLEQLSNDQWALLFPGGGPEALKGRNEEKYSLRWPENPEFVRACALFGATIIPTSTVGAEDMVRIIVDSETVTTTMERLTRLVGRPEVMKQFVDDAKAWQGDSEQAGRSMVPPLGIPAGPDRLYFRFGKPIEVPAGCLDDAELTRRVYDEVRGKVEEGIGILLRRREGDMYRSLEKREEFAKIHGDGVQAPASPGWAWTRGQDAYLDEELQPNL